MTNDCCDGTGFADYAPVPCPNPECPVDIKNGDDMLSVMEILIVNIARAVRAHLKSQDEKLPKDQRDFHAGRREAYMQDVAMIAQVEVKEVRKHIERPIS